ncbi:MAG TPA: alternative ribosome rescue aminoacyl-tRNA hydrolase ArfB [Gemmatimonadaceae bacterium]|nr:alternative ribosome rescue aminoacyl-tRNA hydrolase ArfB [Gemmatimonadaceae bacterium]
MEQASGGGEGAERGLAVPGGITIPRAELEARASRAGGAGGQHVNTSSTRIELRWNVAQSRALDDATRARLREKLATRIDSEGVLRVVSSARRSQLQNREAAEARLVELVAEALRVEKPRRKTRPSRAAKEARLDEKRRNSERKRNRRGFGDL